MAIQQWQEQEAHQSLLRLMRISNEFDMMKEYELKFEFYTVLFVLRRWLFLYMYIYSYFDALNEMILCFWVIRSMEMFPLPGNRVEPQLGDGMGFGHQANVGNTKHLLTLCSKEARNVFRWDFKAKVSLGLFVLVPKEYYYHFV